MINTEKLKSILRAYKGTFLKYWNNEKYKWEAIQQFQTHWNIDAENFGDMFKLATEKADNLLMSRNNFPKFMIIDFAKADDSAVREMFRDLYDESQDLADRVTAFRAQSKALRAKYNNGTWKSDYQSTNAISTYLWLKFPDKYYIYKYELYKKTAEELMSDYKPKANGSAETMLGGFRMYDEICAVIQQDAEFRRILENALTDTCYLDPMMKTATVDFGFFLARYYPQKMKAPQEGEDWFPSDYAPGITAEKWLELLQDPAVFTPNALQIMRRMKECGGQATCTQLAVKFGEDWNFYNRGSTELARRAAEKINCPLAADENGKNLLWPVLYTGKNTSSEDKDAYIWKLRPELSEALDKIDLSGVALYANAEAAPEIQSDCGHWWLTANPALWSFSSIRVGEGQSYTLYNANGNKRRIFQNFLDAKVGDIVLGYEAAPIKKVVAICRITQASDGKAIRLEKVEGLTNPVEYQALRECTELEKMEFFVRPNGSLFKLTKGEFDFIMDVIREGNPLPQLDTVIPKYSKQDFLNAVYMKEARYNDLEALLRNKKNVILQGAPGVGKTFAAKRLAYAMMGEQDDSRIELVQFHQNYSYEDFVLGYRPAGAEFKLTEGIFYRFCQTAANHPDKDYFFLIDEINRGNLSKIFGELLMLIEKDYRGAKVTLAYNGMPFSVPENLYILGMMNTADRSLAMIDYALRRRFSFFEMKPGFDSDGFIAYQKGFANKAFDALIDQVKALNGEISADKSLGPGFQIGHSYFCGRKPDECTIGWMRAVVEYDILPMLSEYWFDEPTKLQNWKKNLRGVLNDEG